MSRPSHLPQRGRRVLYSYFEICCEMHSAVLSTWEANPSNRTHRFLFSGHIYDLNRKTQRTEGLWMQSLFYLETEGRFHSSFLQSLHDCAAWATWLATSGLRSPVSESSKPMCMCPKCICEGWKPSSTLPLASSPSSQLQLGIWAAPLSAGRLSCSASLNTLYRNSKWPTKPLHPPIYT